MSLFPIKSISVTELRSDRLILAGGTYFKAASLTDDYIYGKLVSAEAEAARRLRIQLEPTTIFAGEPSSAEISACGTSPYLEESAYDYEPGLWNKEDWGYLVLRQRPVISITSIEFVYPSPVAGSFQVPPAWIRLDKKAGHIRFVPAGATVMSGAMGAMMISMMAGGHNVPQMIKVRYVSGLANAAVSHPDLIGIIKKIAVLGIVNDAFVPQSGSISADGLSQSFSADTAKYQEHIDNALDMIRSSVQGIRCMVM